MCLYTISIDNSIQASSAHFGEAPATKNAGPCAQGVSDPVIVPRPMSQGRPGLFVRIKDYAFLRASAHESVPLAGYSPATRRIPVVGRDSTFNENPRVKRRSALHCRIWVPLEPSWKQLGANLGELGLT